jgi:hypothetical protein
VYVVSKNQESVNALLELFSFMVNVVPQLFVELMNIGVVADASVSTVSIKSMENVSQSSPL